MTRVAIFVPAALLLFAIPAAAQGASAADDAEWHADRRALWHVDVGYPTRISGGVTAVIGRSRRLSGYESLLRGLMIGGDVGLVSAQARVGWAWLRPYDAGVEGHSVEVVLVTPIGLESRLGGPYLGPQTSFYWGVFRLSGAVLMGFRGREDVVADIHAALLPRIVTDPVCCRVLRYG